MTDLREALTDEQCDAIQMQVFGHINVQEHAYQQANALIRAAFAAGAASVPREDPVAWMYAAEGEGTYIVLHRNRQAPDPGSRWTETPLYAATGVTK